MLVFFYWIDAGCTYKSGSGTSAMSVLSKRLINRMEACLNKLDGVTLGSSVASTEGTSSVDESVSVAEDEVEVQETEADNALPSLSGLDEDVFQAVTDLSDVSTLSRLSQISAHPRKPIRGLSMNRR